MTAGHVLHEPHLAQRLAEAEATIEALLSGQIDAVVDSKSKTPVLLAKAQEALQQSQKRLRDIIDGLGPAMFVGLMTPQGILIEANRPVLAAACLKPEDVIGQPFADTYWWAYSREVQQQMRDAIARGARGEASRFDARVRVADGQLIDVDFSLEVLRDAAGAVAFLVPSAVVITERKLAAEALRTSLDEFQTLAEAMPQLVWVTRPDGWNIYSNQQWVDYTGLTLEASYGQGWIKSFHPDDQERAAREWEHSTVATSIFSLECRLRRADGVYRWWLIRGVPLKDAGGTILKWFGTCTDIHDLKVAEEALRTSEEQYRQIVETTTDGIIKADGDAVIVFANRRFAEMLGYEPPELIGMSLFAFMDADAKAIVTQSLENRRQGVRSLVDETYRHKNGSKISVNVAGSALVDREGKYVGTLGVVRDVTDQKKLQAQLMVSDRMASVGTLAAGVAHEINNPLAAVIANLEYIGESLGRAAGGDAPHRDGAWLHEEIKGPLADAREAAQRVRLIVRDLKVFSRSPTDESRGPVDVQAIMESSLRMAWNEIRHRAHLVKHYGTVSGVTANEARLGQVFLNLLVNAAQALPEGRAEHNEIRVTTRLDGERVVVEVRDTGAGIPPEIVGRIFDPFFTTKAVGVGTGLGLAICQRIVTDMGGELTVESEMGKGTTFRVALPVAGEEESTVAHVEAVPVAGRRGRILVVDDEALVLRSVKRILSKDHDVVVSGAAKEALAMCVGGETFDLILCDLMMPEMTGMDLHRELSRVSPDQASRMIFVTGGAFTEKARTFLSETPKEQIEKPFEAANLRAIVRRYVRASPPLPAVAQR